MVAFLMNLGGQYEGVFPVYGNEVALGKLLKICQMVLQKSEVARLEKEIQFVVVEHREVLETMNYRFTFMTSSRPKRLNLVFILIMIRASD